MKPSEFAAPSVVEFGLRTADLLPPGVAQHRHRLRPARPARRWSATRASTRSPSPAASPPRAASSRAAADNLTPAIFELGGKSAFVICPDADLDLAVADALKGIAVPERRGLLRRLAALPPRRRSETSSWTASPQRSGGSGSATRSTPPTQVGPLVSAEHRDACARPRRNARLRGRRILLAGGAEPCPLRAARRRLLRRTRP